MAGLGKGSRAVVSLSYSAQYENLECFSIFNFAYSFLFPLFPCRRTVRTELVHNSFSLLSFPLPILSRAGHFSNGIIRSHIPLLNWTSLSLIF